MQFLTTTSEGYISLFFTLALMLVLLYFMIYRPQIIDCNLLLKNAAQDEEDDL